MASNGNLNQKLWNSADILRSKMDANEYKSYLLGLIFYKFLSDNLLYSSADLLGEEVGNLEEAQENYEKAFLSEDKEDLISELKYQYAYYIEPDLTFTSLIKNIYDGTFQLESLQQAFREIEQSSPAFENLFSDVDLYSKRLGTTPHKQNETISEVMKELAPLDLSDYDGDVLGDAYEYLIGQFASDSGKKAGEFYTPQSVSRLMTEIVIHGKENQRGFTIYDATMGSGSLLLNVKKFSNEPGTIRYFGQEINNSTYNLARMNMILHNVPIENQVLRNADTLDDDWPTEEPTNFDGVIMNPPYSAKWSSYEGFLQDPRFAPFGVLAPKSYADYAFLLHGYHHLKRDGVMAIVLPHGPLFRGGREGTIRKSLLEMGAIDTVIGLPGDVFFNTSIPTIIMILKKDRTDREVFFIDASKEFERVGTQNILQKDHIEKIVEAYLKKEEIDKFSHLASFEEVKENDYNLNIPRYVDTFEPEPEVYLDEVTLRLNESKRKLREVEDELYHMTKSLRGDDEETKKDLLTSLQRLGEDLS